MAAACVYIKKKEKKKERNTLRGRRGYLTAIAFRRGEVGQTGATVVRRVFTLPKQPPHFSQQPPALPLTFEHFLAKKGEGTHFFFRCAVVKLLTPAITTLGHSPSWISAGSYSLTSAGSKSGREIQKIGQKLHQVNLRKNKKQKNFRAVKR
jgi:hypothetical protein